MPARHPSPRRLLGAAIAASLLAVAPAAAAVIEVVRPRRSASPEVRVSGTIELGVSSRLLSALHSHPEARRVVIDSQGGSAVEGQRLGRLIRTAAVETQVRPGRVATSAAAFAFLGGAPRCADGKVLLHAPYIAPGPVSLALLDALDATRREARSWLVSTGISLIADAVLAAGADEFVGAPGDLIARRPAPRRDGLGLLVALAKCLVGLPPSFAIEARSGLHP